MAKQGGSCKIEICNIQLLKEFFQTCSEYLGLVPKPFNPIPLKQLFGCSQSNWNDAYQQWGLIQFWMAVIMGILSMLVLIIGYGSDAIGTGISNLITQIIMAYIIAHLGWFAVVRRKGCCCCFVVCCEAPQLLLLWGVLLILWGVLSVISALGNAGLCDLCFLIFIFQAVYAVTLIYLGIAAIRLWQAAGSEVVPGAVEVDVPDKEGNPKPIGSASA